MHLRCIRLLIMVAGFGAFAPPAMSQLLEEIVVTATKREQSLQDVPLSINAIQGEFVTDFNLTNFEQLDVPGFKIPRAGMGDNIFMRGIGSGPNLGFEQAVPIYMNGLYFGRGRGSRAGFMDLARIEVVKGPQPTYFGKNAIAGAASLVWNRPTDEFEGYVDGHYEVENQEYAVTGVLSGPLSDTVNGRIALRTRELSEGWLMNTTTGNSEPELSDTTARATLTWDAGDTFAATATVFYSRDEENGRNQQTGVCPLGGMFAATVSDCTVDEQREGFNIFFPIADINTGSTRFDYPVPQGFAESDHLNTSFNELTLSGASVEIQADVGDGLQLTSLTGTYEFDNVFTVGGDQTPVDLIDGAFTEVFRQFSQELRLQSPEDRAVTWLAGFYFDRNDNRQVTGNNGGMMSSFYLNNEEEADSWAVFGEIEFSLGDATRLNLGGRYTEVDKGYIKEGCRGPPYTEAAPTVNCGTGMFPIAFFSIDDQRSFDAFQPAIGLERDVNDDVMAYISYKEGFKAGGWDFGPLNPRIDELRFDHEEVDAWEVGAKMTLGDGRATLNLAAFNSRFTNLQVTAFNTVLEVVNVFNAANATSQGLDADFNWAITDRFEVQGNLTFLNSEYDDFPGADCFTSAAPPQYPTCDASTNPEGRTRNLGGEATPYAPDFAGRLTLNWNTPLTGALELDTQLSVFTTSEYFTSGDNDPIDIQSGFSKWDLRLAVGPPEGSWDVALVGRNLSNEITCGFSGDIPGSAVGAPIDPITGAVQTGHFCLTERPRTIALQGTRRF